MGKQLTQGDVVGKYRVDRQIAVGGTGVGYLAHTPEEGPVFLKLVHSPGGRSDWFEAYVDYVGALFDRIRTTGAASYCVDPIEVFVVRDGPKVHHRTLYEVFEFIDGSTTLESLLANAKTGSTPLSGARRLTQAKVFMAAIARIHAVGIVHCDLKPDNVQMLHDPSIEAGFRVKVIDIDRALLADQTPPWDSGTANAVGYAFTPFYQSPEHIAKARPTKASDVFTCGIMLHEILGNGHPYRSGSDDIEQYTEKVLANDPPRLALPEGILSDEVAERVIEIVRRSLLCDPASRPSARDIHQTLLGRYSPVEPIASPEVPKVASSDDIGEAEPSDAPPATYLVLEGAEGRRLRINIDTSVGRGNGASLSDDYKYLANPQFRLARESDSWILIPVPDTKHATCLNGEPIDEHSPLSTGDRVCVASRTSGKQKCSLTVAIHPRTDEA